MLYWEVQIAITAIFFLAGKSRSKHDANTKGRELNLPTRESSADSPSAIRFLSRLKQEVPNALIFLPGNLPNNQKS